MLVNKTMLNDFKKRHTNFSLAWIDYKIVCDFVSHGWINECMELFGISDNVRNFFVRKFFERSMEQCKLSLTSNGEGLGDVDEKRGIFQGESLSPLLFVSSMVPLSLILK